jgi:putative transcriptional regulator
MACFSESLKGKFLIATPSLNDPNFLEGVVFLCEHNDEGAFGLVINRKANFKAETYYETGAGKRVCHMDLYLGGPVHTNHILILCRSSLVVPDGTRVTDDVTLVSNLTAPSQAQVFNQDNHENVRLYLGCAGWGKSQLEGEIAAGVWKVLSARTDMIFSSESRRVWKENLARLGGKYVIFSRMPEFRDLYRN